MIGFWNENNQPIVTTKDYLPEFEDKIKLWKESLDQFQDYFKQKLLNGHIDQYLGWSRCRVCHFDKNGDCTITYLQYTFPNGYLHYIINHHIDVPIEFQKYVIESDVPVIINKSKEELEHERKMNVFKIMIGMCGLQCL